MRYKVVFDEVDVSWAVIDTAAAGMVLGFHEVEDEARQAARREEDRRPAPPGMEE